MLRRIASCCVVLVAACEDDVVETLPTLDDRTVTTAEDTAVTFEVAVTAADATAVALTIVTRPLHGALTGAGPWTYTPATNYNGSDSLVVLGEDANGSATATVTIIVTPVDDAPVAHPDSFATGFNVLLNIPQAAILANDTDLDGPALSVTAVEATAHGVPVLSDGNILFTSEAGFDGVASFEYTMSDGTHSAHATVIVTIGLDAPPVATDDTVITDEDTAVEIADAALLANDSDADHQTLRITLIENVTHGSVTRDGTRIPFVPEVDFHGLAGFDYTVTDGYLTDVASVAITVASVNDAPVAAPDAATTEEDTPLTLT